MMKDEDARQWCIFRVHTGLTYGRVHLEDRILSPNTYGLKYEMVLEWGFRQLS